MKSDNEALYMELQDLEYDVISKTEAIKYITESINEIKRQISCEHPTDKIYSDSYLTMCTSCGYKILKNEEIF